MSEASCSDRRENSGREPDDSIFKRSVYEVK